MADNEVCEVDHVEAAGSLPEEAVNDADLEKDLAAVVLKLTQVVVTEAAESTHSMFDATGSENSANDEKMIRDSAERVLHEGEIDKVIPEQLSMDHFAAALHSSGADDLSEVLPEDRVTPTLYTTETDVQQLTVVDNELMLGTAEADNGKVSSNGGAEPVLDEAAQQQKMVDSTECLTPLPGQSKRAGEVSRQSRFSSATSSGSIFSAALSRAQKQLPGIDRSQRPPIATPQLGNHNPTSMPKSTAAGGGKAPYQNKNPPDSIPQNQHSAAQKVKQNLSVARRGDFENCQTKMYETNDTSLSNTLSGKFSSIMEKEYSDFHEGDSEYTERTERGNSESPAYAQDTARNQRSLSKVAEENGNYRGPSQRSYFNRDDDVRSGDIDANHRESHGDTDHDSRHHTPHQAYQSAAVSARKTSRHVDEASCARERERNNSLRSIRHGALGNDKKTDIHLSSPVASRSYDTGHKKQLINYGDFPSSPAPNVSYESSRQPQAKQFNNSKTGYQGSDQYRSGQKGRGSQNSPHSSKQNFKSKNDNYAGRSHVEKSHRSVDILSDKSRNFVQHTLSESERTVGKPKVEIMPATDGATRTESLLIKFDASTIRKKGSRNWADYDSDENDGA